MKNIGLTGLFTWLIIWSLPSIAANNPHQFYADTGYNMIDSDQASEGAWTTTLGYSYFLSPYVGVDLGYTDTLSNGASFQNENSETIKVKYRSFYAGARIEQPISNFASVYARGGVGQVKLEETNISVDPEITQDYSGVNPYLGIGAKVQPTFIEKLELSVELKYQDLESEYSSTSFTVGARFSL